MEWCNGQIKDELILLILNSDTLIVSPPLPENARSISHIAAKRKKRKGNVMVIYRDAIGQLSYPLLSSTCATSVSRLSAGSSPSMGFQGHPGAGCAPFA